MDQPLVVRVPPEELYFMDWIVLLSRFELGREEGSYTPLLPLFSLADHTGYASQAAAHEHVMGGAPSL